MNEIKFGKKKNIDTIYFSFSDFKKDLIKNFLKDEVKYFLEIFKKTKFSFKKDESLPLIFNNKKILFIGLGNKKEFEDYKFRKIIKNSINNAFLKQINKINIIFQNNCDETILCLIDSIIIGLYSFNKYKTKNKKTKKTFYIDKNNSVIFENHIKINKNVNLSRDLVNENSDILNSNEMEKKIKEILPKDNDFSIEVIGKKQMQKLGFNLFLAVNQASKYEPKLIIVKYNGDKKNKEYQALIGKGMTFDSGGLNLKPTGSIETMREDMAGAASVFGVLNSIIFLRPKKNIIFGFAMAENMIGNNAYKPGDVFIGYSGKSVEIKNTDAEGRLVLADSNAYITKNYNVTNTINIATLTGAVVVALGNDHSGLMSDDDLLANNLLEISKEVDDPLWRLPIYPKLKEHISSDIADIKNVGLGKGNCGSISAGEFLRQFIIKGKWAHIDIAGTAFVEQSAKDYYNYGGTGSCVRLLSYYFLK